MGNIGRTRYTRPHPRVRGTLQLRRSMEFSGRLSAFPPANILQWASHERRTGVLVVRRSSTEKRVFFREGRVVGCLSSDPSEHYGQYLLLHGYLEEGAFVRALRHCKSEGVRLGSSLVELGLLDEQEVRESLYGQLVDAVCDLFLWPRGVFFFRAEAPPRELIAPRPVDTMRLVMEGTRWVDELARIRRVFIHDYVVLRRGPRWPGSELRPLEARICAAVDGDRGLREVHGAARGSWYRFLEAAYGLCLAEVLDIATLVDVQVRDSGEIPLLDLMLEQAAEDDREALAERRRSVPFDLVLELCPAWAPGVEWSQAGDADGVLQRFRLRLDGRTPLGEALSAEPELREKEIELFELALARGQLALVPRSGSAEDEASAEEGAAEEGPEAGEPWWRRPRR